MANPEAEKKILYSFPSLISRNNSSRQVNKFWCSCVQGEVHLISLSPSPERYWLSLGILCPATHFASLREKVKLINASASRTYLLYVIRVPKRSRQDKLCLRGLGDPYQVITARCVLEYVCVCVSMSACVSVYVWCYWQVEERIQVEVVVY